jgi:pseudouridine-5'-phosphate glycosidase
MKFHKADSFIAEQWCTGLDDAELDHLGKHGKQAWKTSRRDIPYVMANVSRQTVGKGL